MKKFAMLALLGAAMVGCGASPAPTPSNTTPPAHGTDGPMSSGTPVHDASQAPTTPATPADPAAPAPEVK